MLNGKVAHLTLAYLLLTLHDQGVSPPECELWIIAKLLLTLQHQMLYVMIILLPGIVMDDGLSQQQPIVITTQINYYQVD